MLDGWTGGIIVDADSELFTKSAARELTFTANFAGCTFVGRPLVEGTSSLAEFCHRSQEYGYGFNDCLPKERRASGPGDSGF